PPPPPPGPTAPLPSPRPSDLEALCQRVDAAHRPDGTPARVTAVTGSFEVHLLDAQAAQGGQADIDLKYLEWLRPDQKLRHLLRYDVRDAGAPVAAGRDRNGYWHLFQGKARDLTEAEAQDRAACDRNTNLVRQMLRFLAPGQVLRSATAPSPVQKEPLQLGREPAIDCEVVTGGLPAFPLQQTGGEDAPVLAKVFVDAKTSQLVAIDVQPLNEGRPDPSRREFVRLGDLRRVDGHLVPHRLVHLHADADGKLRARTRVVVANLQLQPKLQVEDLDRPK
ncbi:MAG: hypothetical protein JNK49_00210, partial [Planctomycetes bacterium]|nr:hypothetical protein [Planctomycetota bacterium]